MARINDETIDRIKSQVDIVDVLSDFLTLKRVGQNYRALSPFANEKTPSFYVSPSKGIFKDFSSGKGGDAISFVMEHEGLSYVETLKFLAKKYGIEVQEEEQTDEQLQQQNERESLFIVTNFANDYFRDILLNHPDGKAIGLSYFKERGFTEKIVKDFELGYTLDTWDGLLTAAKAKGYNPEILEKAGLIIRKEAKSYDRFRARVMFPIHSIAGKPIAFGARTLSSDKKQPKYINSPETSIYHKSKVLYGLYQSKNAIRNEDNCYLVEGYTDVISLHMSGVENVVSSSGTSLTEEQIRLVGRYTKNITVLFDGDAAGIRASLRGIDMILENGMNVKAVVFPEGQDPDSYSRSLGSSKFQKYLKEKAEDFLKFKIGLFVNEATDDPVKKADLIRDIVESISKIPDPIRRTVYIQESSRLLDMGEDVLYAELNKIIIKKHRAEKTKQIQQERAPIGEMPPDVVEEQVETAKSSLYWQEREYIRLLLMYGEHEEDNQRISDYLLNELEEVNFETAIYAEILEVYKQRLQKGVLNDADFFIKNSSEEIKQEVIDLTTEKYDISENWHDKFKIYVPKEAEILTNVVFTNIHRLKLRVLQDKIDKCLEALKIEKNEQQQTELLKEINNYKHVEMEIAKVLGNVVSR